MIAHTAPHPLPISNGYSVTTRSGCAPDVTVWCGRCRGAFTPDSEWAGRFIASRDAALRSAIGGPPPYGTTAAEVGQAVAELRDQLDRLIPAPASLVRSA